MSRKRSLLENKISSNKLSNASALPSSVESSSDQSNLKTSNYSDDLSISSNIESPFIFTSNSSRSSNSLNFADHCSYFNSSTSYNPSSAFNYSLESGKSSFHLGTRSQCISSPNNFSTTRK